ncbi:MAG: sensor domain-containing protein [Actinomycetia bacterium]|nr:sensor domain-containing protein [Actinomycetes bacterium]
MNRNRNRNRNRGLALPRTCTVGAVIAVSVLLSACVSEVEGTAIRAQGPGADLRNVPPLKEAMLDDVLLTISELNSIVGSTRMEVTSDLDEMTDHSEDVSDPDCLGAIYGAEDPVYEGTDWIAVRDQVAREPDQDNDHWVEQTAVLYPAATNAQDFFDRSSATWQDCANEAVAVADGDYVWILDEVEVGDTMITQMASQEDAGGWACQHTLSLVSNLTVEVWACGYSIFDDSVQIASAMIENAAGQ